MKSAVSAARADRQSQRRHHQTVGKLFGVVLHPRVADRRGFDQRRDLAGGGLGADADGADGELAVANDGRGEDGRAPVAHHRQALAGDGLLVDRGVAVDDLAVDRDHLARIDHDEVADRELRRGDRGDHAVAHDPGGLGLEFQQFAHRACAGRPRSDRGSSRRA